MVSGCVAKYARALSTDTVNAANSLKYWLWVARFFVFFHRYAIGLESGEYDGRGSTVIRARWAAKKAWGAALVWYRAPSWMRNRCCVVCAISICKNPWELSEL